MTKVRIATVQRTGHRFVVVSLDFRSNKAVLRGEVRAFRARRSTGAVVSVTYDGGESRPLSEVTVREVPFTVELGRELLAQGERSLLRQPAPSLGTIDLNANDPITGAIRKVLATPTRKAR